MADGEPVVARGHFRKVKGDGSTAVPVGRETVPDPLRQRIRMDLEEAGVDPDVEGRSL